MKVYINSILFPIKVLGPGNRIGLWFQGCSIKCNGCMSIHTWEQEKKYETTTENIINNILGYRCKRLTISGGEPFEQADALRDILEGIKNEVEDVIVYSGMKKEKIIEKFNWISNLCSVLISEPYMKNSPSDKIWKGSENQTATVFKNEKFYRNWLEQEKNKKLQLINNTFVGIL